MPWCHYIICKWSYISFYLAFSSSNLSNCCCNSNLISPINSKSTPHGAIFPLTATNCCLNLLMPPPLIHFLQYLQYNFPSMTWAWIHVESFHFGLNKESKCKIDLNMQRKNKKILLFWQQTIENRIDICKFNEKKKQWLADN